MAWPRGKPRKPVTIEDSPIANSDCPSENTGVEVAKLRFGAVHLDHEVDRLGGSKGLARASTSFFGANSGCTVELDPTTGLVSIVHTDTGASIVVPRERVKRFEPLPA